jgi:hypothetical protein
LANQPARQQTGRHGLSDRQRAQLKLPRVVKNDFLPQFALALALKDVHLALEAAGADRFAALACLADNGSRSSTGASATRISPSSHRRSRGTATRPRTRQVRSRRRLRDDRGRPLTVRSATSRHLDVLVNDVFDRPPDASRRAAGEPTMDNWKDSFDADRMPDDKAFSVPLAGFEPSRMTLGRCL